MTEIRAVKKIARYLRLETNNNIETWNSIFVKIRDEENISLICKLSCRWGLYNVSTSLQI